DAEARPFSHLAVGEYIPPGLLDDAVYRREPEAGALAHVLGGEEWLEDLAHDIGWNANAGVAHFDQHILTRCHVERTKLHALALGDVARAYGEAAALWPPILPLDRQIDDHLHELALVGLHIPEVAAGQDFKLYGLAQRAIEQGRQIGQHLTELQDLRLQGLPA